MHTCVSVYVCVYAERERISVTLVTQGCASDLSLHVRARVCWHYFANLSTVTVLSAGAYRETKRKKTHKQHYKHRKIHVK
jgi:hypothetical protein